MKIITSFLLAALLVTAGMHALAARPRSARQPFPERGFWVAETTPDRQSTIVRYYAHSNHMVAQATEPAVLDIRKLLVRKYLNEQLRKALEKDTTAAPAIRLYDIR